MKLNMSDEKTDGLRKEFQSWAKNRKMPLSEKNDFWTPVSVFESLQERFGPFDIDVAASDENHLAPSYYTIKDDALRQNWEGFVWCNPPYVKQKNGTTIKDWIVKAKEAVFDGKVFRAVLLIPAYTSNGYWHETIFPYASHLVFFRYRLDFGGPNQRAGGASRNASVAVVFSKVWSGASTQVMTMSNRGEWLTEETWDREVLKLKLKNGVTAKGFLTEGERFVVLAGSTANGKPRPSCTKREIQCREQLEKEGAIDRVGEMLRFQRDVTFTSPSAAAATIRGMPSNGRRLWAN